MSDVYAQKPAFLSKQRIIAPAHYNRWLVPPAALAIHLCIGMAYGFSVFWLPLSKALGVDHAIACPVDSGFWLQLFSRQCDWKISTLGWMYTLFFILLGCSAALWGGWLERVGPRRVGLLSAFCWCGGMLISALGVYLHQFWIMLIGSGVIGGIGLGLGYISPVSTLIKWFPDRRGLATGLAIMGFGGGAMIGSPLAVDLMKYFATPTNNGVAATFVCMACIYAVFMTCGALMYRIPALGWKPAHWQEPQPSESSRLMTRQHVHVKKVWGIPQFWLVWFVLCMNISAGIGILGIASPMLQEVFAGSLIGIQLSFNALNTEQLARIAAIAAGFTALLSLFNIGGRLFWASFSDQLGRKVTYSVFLILGAILYISIPMAAQAGHKLIFVASICIIISMYGGGFATLPAYLADLFGTQMVGAIHGRLLTAWATAGILGPVLVNHMRDYQLSLGMATSQVYNQTMYILAGLLCLGLLANLSIRPVASKHFMTESELALEQASMQRQQQDSQQALHNAPAFSAPMRVVDQTVTVEQAAVMLSGHVQYVYLALAWLAVLIPISWGIYRTLLSVQAFF
ncbi:OFA family MFS transporter [Acinetobacter larvae]|uniref:MFS transporter n=1 Tax=Acinetobacter larvae TaxID=1789224 RepID=A0A1B2M0M5_9GAMM|nr:OFA family MFS transporter [Acinetobacter larvae]AOA58719.1 MFS transporter [Acinetobacter larvae]